MIIVYIDSKEDTSTFARLYEGLDDCTLLINPNRSEVEKILTERPTETLLCFGHGTEHGLFDKNLEYFLIDRHSTPLLKEREMIGIWCYASAFGWANRLRGFFTNMFISNKLECEWNNCGEYTDEEIFVENEKFAVKINKLIKDGTPMYEWTETFEDEIDSDLEFVSFNYSGMIYLYGEDDILSLPEIEEQEKEVIKRPEGWTFADEMRSLDIEFQSLFDTTDEDTTE